LSDYEYIASDTYMDGKIIVVCEGTLDSSGYGDFVDDDGDIVHQHYRSAESFRSERDANDAAMRAKKKYGGFYLDFGHLECRRELVQQALEALGGN
jgi:hypothetical protein